jgi:hypothetical protein
VSGYLLITSSWRAPHFIGLGPAREQEGAAMCRSNCVSGETLLSTQEEPNQKVLMTKPQVAWDPVSCGKAASSLYPCPKWLDVLTCPLASYSLGHKCSVLPLPKALKA